MSGSRSKTPYPEGSVGKGGEAPREPQKGAQKILKILNFQNFEFFWAHFGGSRGSQGSSPPFPTLPSGYGVLFRLPDVSTTFLASFFTVMPKGLTTGPKSMVGYGCRITTGSNCIIGPLCSKMTLAG